MLFSLPPEIGSASGLINQQPSSFHNGTLDRRLNSSPAHTIPEPRPAQLPYDREVSRLVLEELRSGGSELVTEVRLSGALPTQRTGALRLPAILALQPQELWPPGCDLCVRRSAPKRSLYALELEY